MYNFVTFQQYIHKLKEKIGTFTKIHKIIYFFLKTLFYIPKLKEKIGALKKHLNYWLKLSTLHFWVKLKFKQLYYPEPKPGVGACSWNQWIFDRVHNTDDDQFCRLKLQPKPFTLASAPTSTYIKHLKNPEWYSLHLSLGKSNDVLFWLLLFIIINAKPIPALVQAWNPGLRIWTGSPLIFWHAFWCTFNTQIRIHEGTIWGIKQENVCLNGNKV